MDFSMRLSPAVRLLSVAAWKAWLGVERGARRYLGGTSARILAAAVAAVVLAACASTAGPSRPVIPPAGPPLRTTQPAEVGPSALPRNQQLIPRAGAPAPAVQPGGLMRAALLVPLTGPSAALGQALVNAAQMALFEVADEHLVLQIYDTQGTPDDTARVTTRAITEGAQIIL